MDNVPVYYEYYYPQAALVRVSNIKKSPMNCQQILEVIAKLNKANLYIKTKEYQKAIALIDKNILLLGYQYLPETQALEDDTDVKLMLGNIEQQKENWTLAAYLKRNVLESRVSVFQKVHQCPLSK